MALLSEVGTFTSPVSTGNQTVTLDSGIWGGATPKVVLFWGCVENVVSDGVIAHSSQMFGCAISSTSRATVSAYSAGAQGTSNAHRRHSNTKCIAVVSFNGATSEEADFVSFGADQFTVDWTTAAATAGLLNYLVLGGDDLTDVYLDEITSPASTGNQSYTGVGFQPDALIGFGQLQASGPPVTGTHAFMHLGVADATSQSSSSICSQDNVATSNTVRLQSSSHFIAGSYVSAPQVHESASRVSLDADGYTLNWDNVQASARYNWILCLKGPQVKVGTFDSPTSASEVSTAIGFKPKSGLFLTAMGPTSATVDDDARIGIGAFDSSTNQASAGAVDEDAQGTTDADRVQRSDRSIAMIDHAMAYTDTAIAYPDGTNLKTYWDNADATAREVAYIVFGDSTDAADQTGLLSEVGTLTSPAATGLQSIALDNSIWGGMTPKVVLFWGGTGLTSDTVDTTGLMSFGVALSSSSRAAIGVSTADNVGTSIADRRHDNTKCVLTLDTNGGLLQAADFVSFGADQFTIDWTTNSYSGRYQNYLVLGGDDLTDVYLDEITSPASTGNQSYTGVGFQPDALLTFSMLDAAPVPTTNIWAALQIGVSDGTTSRSTVASSQDNLGTSATWRTQREIFIDHTTNVITEEAEVASLDADGYTLNWLTVDANVRYSWILCLKGPQVKVLTADQTATNTSADRAIGFVPRAALALTHMGAGTGFSDDVPSAIGTGQSYKFDGENDGIEATDSASLDFGSTDFSISLWVKTSVTSKDGAYDRRLVSRTNAVYDLRLATGVPEIFIGNTGFTFSGATSIATGNWVHVVVTFDRDDVATLYVDGSSVSTVNISAKEADGSGATVLRIGEYDAKNASFLGLMDDVRIYGDKLTSGEVTTLYGGGDHVDSLNAHWKFDGDLLDETANNNDGTASGAVNDDARIGIGAWDYSNNMAFAGAVDEDAQSTTDADRIQDSNEFLKHIDHAQTVVGSCSLAASDTTLTETWTDTDGTQREHAMIVFGNKAVGFARRPHHLPRKQGWVTMR